jgi:hypothetical protein
MSVSAEQYYSKLVDGIPPTDVNEGQNAITGAEEHRMEDITVMDIIGTTQPSTAVQPESAHAHDNTDVIHQWIRLGILIEEMQYVPCSFFPPDHIITIINVQDQYCGDGPSVGQQPT